jgi:hypothetical protein
MAEVQRVLSTSAELQSDRDQYLAPHFRQLIEVLRGLLPKDKRTSLRTDGLLKVLQESMSLASNIRLCPTTYRFSWTFEPADSTTPTALYTKDVERFNIIDQAKAQSIRGGDLIKPGPGGRIGDLMCVVHPELVRKGKNGGQDITLVKATILCEFVYPVTRRRKAN